MKWRLSIAFLFILLLPVQAQAAGGLFGLRAKVGFSFHISSSGCGPCGGGQLGPWYQYWPLSAHFQTPAPIAYPYWPQGGAGAGAVAMPGGVPTPGITPAPGTNLLPTPSPTPTPPVKPAEPIPGPAQPAAPGGFTGPALQPVHYRAVPYPSVPYQYAPYYWYR